MARKMVEASEQFGTPLPQEPLQDYSDLFRFLSTLAGDPKLQRFFVGLAPVSAVDATYTIGANSQEFVPARPNRQYLLIANIGGNDLKVSFGKPAAVGIGITIAAGGFYEPLRPLSTSINMLSVAGTTATVIEG